jgi:hypothetical protein
MKHEDKEEYSAHLVAQTRGVVLGAQLGDEVL